MATNRRKGEEPGWSSLYKLAEAQSGHFSAAQASEIGYYPQRLQKHLRAGRIARARRGVYRLSHFPPSDNEELVVFWLWSEQQGVYSGETALNLHELSDALPSKLYMTVPEIWRTRRLRVPDGLVLYFAEIAKKDRTWMGSVPVTTPKRTVEDCIEHHVQPDLIEQAIVQAKNRGIITTAIAKTLTRKATSHQ